MRDSDREQLVREQQRRLEDAEQLRRERLLHELEAVALDFQHLPEQIGYYLAERVRLRPGDVERVEARLYSIGGMPMVARAFSAAGYMAAPTALPADATTEDWLAGRVGEVHDPSRAKAMVAAMRQPAGDKTADSPPRPGSWADVHGGTRRQLAEDVLRDWREAALRAEARSNTRGRPLPDSLRAELERLTDRPLSTVRVHDDEEAARLAEAHRARALTVGEDIYLGRGQLDPSSPTGRAVLAHEAAHALQQRDAGPASGQLGPASPAHEAEARAVHRAVVSGAPGPLRLSPSPLALAALDGDEHALIGDEVSGDKPGGQESIELDGVPNHQDPQMRTPIKLTTGEMNALAGDFFETLVEMQQLAKTKDGREQLRYSKWRCRNESKDQYDWPALKATPTKDPMYKVRKKAVDTVEDRYMSIAAKNATHFRVGHKTKTVGGMPADSIGRYQHYHELAIGLAYQGKMKEAKAQEAFGQHFLQDSFVAGHVRTPREAVVIYWNKKYPYFIDWFLEEMAWTMAERLNKTHGARNLLTEDGFYTRAMAKMNGMPAVKVAKQCYTLGDLISKSLHDYDNKQGLVVQSELTPQGAAGPYKWKATGDGDLKGKDPLNNNQQTAYLMTKAAAKASLEDLDQVVGNKGGWADVGAAKTALKAANNGKYKALRFLPYEAKGQNKQLDWQKPTIEKLLADPTLGPALINPIKSGKIASVLDGIVNSEKDAILKDAIKTFVDQVKGDTKNLIIKVANFTPRGGGAGNSNRDDNIRAWLADLKARKDTGGLTLLSYQQKLTCIKELLDGACRTDDERWILNVLAAKSADVYPLIDAIGFIRMYKKIDGAECWRFLKEQCKPHYFPKLKLGARASIIRYMIDGATPAKPQYTVLHVLLTASDADFKVLVNAFTHKRLKWELDGDYNKQYRKEKKRRGL